MEKILCKDKCMFKKLIMGNFKNAERKSTHVFITQLQQWLILLCVPSTFLTCSFSFLVYSNLRCSNHPQNISVYISNWWETFFSFFYIITMLLLYPIELTVILLIISNAQSEFRFFLSRHCFVYSLLESGSKPVGCYAF